MSGEDQTAEATPAIEDVAAEAQGNDLDTLLAEYDSTTATPDPEPEAQPVEQVDNADDLRGWAVEVDRERLARRDGEETAAVFHEGRKAIAGFDALPDDFAERWLRNEHTINPDLQQAWDNRHQSDEAGHRARREIDRALNVLHQAAAHENSRIEGRSATEDRNSIVAAMMRGASRTAPAETPPSYSNVTDGEFRDDVKRRYGITIPI